MFAVFGFSLFRFLNIHILQMDMTVNEAIDKLSETRSKHAAVRRQKKLNRMYENQSCPLLMWFSEWTVNSAKTSEPDLSTRT